MPFVFELGTSRKAGRIYVFAAETDDDRQQWMTTLAKVQMLYQVSLNVCRLCQSHKQEVQLLLKNS